MAVLLAFAFLFGAGVAYAQDEFGGSCNYSTHCTFGVEHCSAIVLCGFGGHEFDYTCWT